MAWEDNGSMFLMPSQRSCKEEIYNVVAKRPEDEQGEKQILNSPVDKSTSL